MSFTYDAAQASYTSLNLLRLRIGDTDPAYPLFTDNEVNAIIARCTTGGVLDVEAAVGILEYALGVSPIRVMQSRMATSGGIAMIDEMNQYAERSVVY